VIYGKHVLAISAAFVSFVASSLLFAQDASTKATWDFEQHKLSDEWTAGGKIAAQRVPGEIGQQPKPKRADDLIPGGQVATLDAQPGSTFALRRELPRIPWERAERISFWVARTPEEAKRDADCTLDLLFLDAANRATFSRKVVIKGSGWQQVEVPVEWIAPSPGHVGSWPEVQRLALSFREESHLSIDALQADLAAKPRAAISLATMLPIAFPESPAKQIKSAEREGYVVATNAVDCDPAKVADLLKPVVNQVAADLPLDPPVAPARLLIFATREEYQKFPPRLAERFAKEAAAPKSDGFTLLGWATSSWDEKLGIQRPVFVHEFVHSLLESRLRLANTGEWFQEGLATHYQLQRYPQKNVPQLIQDGIAREQYDLKALTSGKPIAITTYWQAATLCSLLVRDPVYQPKLKELIGAFQKSQSTALEPHLATVLKVDFDQLTTDWKKHCREAFPVK
jgi:hypothetical protein